VGERSRQDQLAPAEAATTLTSAMSRLDTGTALSRADLLSALGTLRQLRQAMASWEPQLIGAAREQGVSWAELAPALGVASRQAAERRYLRLNPHGTEPGLTGEQRVQAARDRRAGDRAVAGWARSNSAALRGLAGQIIALKGLDSGAQASVDRVQAALGADDSAALVDPLVEAGRRLERSHPGLATEIAAIGANTDQIRNGNTRWS